MTHDSLLTRRLDVTVARVRMELSSYWRFAYVCLGGAIGSGARYAIAQWAGRIGGSAPGPVFPFGTFIANAVGSMLLGVLMVWAATHGDARPGLRLALTVGAMGGFTTYSTFNFETLRMLQERAFGLAFGYMAATIVICLGLGALGYWLGTLLLSTSTA